MDAIGSLPKLKSSKPYKECDAGNGEDMISELPDSIVLYILSYLSIKDVLRTTVLSTRWKYLWTSISEIDLDETSYDMGLGMRTSFLDSIQRLLCSHDASCIRKLRLVLFSSVDSSRIHSWLLTAISHKVQELDLSLPAKTLFVLPDSLFTSESLNVLKLDTDSFFKVPSLICLPNLKTLHLTVTFQCDKSAEQFFSGCPVLEELVLYDCIWKHTERITISLPTLRTLIIRGRPFSPDHLLDCVVTIYAENLHSFEYRRCLAIELLLCNISSLMNAYIDAKSLGRPEEEFPQRVIKLLTGIQDVKFLALSNDTLECLRFEENLHACLPTFYNLTHFKVMNGEMGGHITNQVLMHFLQKSPTLEALEIPEVFHPSNDWLLTIVPECLISFLKTVRISYFQDCATELLFLKYLLDNANMLERITIFYPDLVKNEKGQNEFMHRLKASCTRSTSCVIEFI